MLKSLLIKNFILIDELTLEFHPGFNVFTGETGAGKSIIINAIDVVLGSKTNKEVIKSGQDKATLELSIAVSNKFDKEIFECNGIEFEEELVISREITPTTTRSRVNGVLVTQDFIKEIRESLIDIHTQHQNYNYIQSKTHIKLLDSYGGEGHNKLLSEYRRFYSDFIQIEKKLELAIKNSNSTEQQIEFLKFQINEIQSVNIENLAEDVELENELSILLNAEKLKELSFSSYWTLYGEDDNIIGTMGAVKSNLSRLSQMDVSTIEFEEDIVNCLETIKDLASRLRNYSERQELDNKRIDIIQERIDLLGKLKRKYGNSLDNVLVTYDNLSKELESIEFSQEEVINLESEKKELLCLLTNIANELSESRKRLAKVLSDSIILELEKLELPKVRFSVDIKNQDISESGIDKVEFLISTNISEELKPLAKVASGGEISRVMLAIKTIFTKADRTNTVIFDEIDTGISGKASQSVADSISNLSKEHQVIVITHQPIIAAKADSHFYVSKDQNEQTKVNVYNLKGENKIKAIAILSSGEINEDSMNFAKKLIAQHSY